MLCSFLLYNKVNQLYVYIYPLFFGFPYFLRVLQVTWRIFYIKHLKKGWHIKNLVGFIAITSNKPIQKAFMRLFSLSRECSLLQPPYLPSISMIHRTS